MNQDIESMRSLWLQGKRKQLKDIDPNLKRDLSHGWLTPYLVRADAYTWRRWEHWQTLLTAEGIGDKAIPQIQWGSGGSSMVTGPGFKAIHTSLNCITRSGGWQGWSGWTHMNYFLDWLLFGFGDASQLTLPEESSGCEGASMRLYQLFDLNPLLLWPYDYLGDILAESNHGKHNGFYPTPMDICHMMVMMQMDGEDVRDKTVCDPCVGTGRMLLAASNFSYRLHGQDKDQTVIKATLVNGYCYAPWLVRPFPDSFFSNADPASEVETGVQPLVEIKTNNESHTDSCQQQLLFA